MREVPQPPLRRWLYWPIKLAYSDMRFWRWFQWHGWSVGSSGLERTWYGWTFHLGPLLVLFGSSKRKVMTLSEYSRWLDWYVDYYQELDYRNRSHASKRIAQLTIELERAKEIATGNGARWQKSAELCLRRQDEIRRLRAAITVMTGYGRPVERDADHELRLVHKIGRETLALSERPAEVPLEPLAPRHDSSAERRE